MQTPGRVICKRTNCKKYLSSQISSCLNKKSQEYQVVILYVLINIAKVTSVNLLSVRTTQLAPLLIGLEMKL